MVPTPGGLRVTLASTKTLKTRAQAVALFVPTILGSPYCPVAAWQRALQLLPAAPDALAFLVGPGVPPTTRELTSTLREALRDAGVRHASRYTFHSLCQGTAQACAAQGVDLSAIMAQGTWQSGAYLRRLAPPRSPSPGAMFWLGSGHLLGRLPAGPRGGPRRH